MATLLGNSYSTLRPLLRPGQERRIGNNTTAYLSENAARIDVRLHGSLIVTLYAHGPIRATLAGYPTVTTRERVNQFLHAAGARGIRQHKGRQYHRRPDGHEYEVNPLDSVWVTADDLSPEPVR